MNEIKKIALVTGATRGIGRAIAERLVKDGFFVVGTATSASGADAISGYLGESGCAFKLDVTDSDSIANVLETIKTNHGDIMTLVNNAGITRDNLLMRMSDTEWNDIIQTNFKKF